MSITFEVPNLDDASVDPHDYDELAVVLRTLMCYCVDKHSAMRFRNAGYVDSALRVEREMERLYATLPEWARW